MRHSFALVPSGRTSITMSPTTFARSRGAFGIGDAAGPVVELPNLHAQQQHGAVRSEIDAVMEGFRLDRNAVLRRRAVAIAAGRIPLPHDVAGERHLEHEPVDDGDQQIAARHPPHALHRHVRLVDARQRAGLIDADEPSAVRLLARRLVSPRMLNSIVPGSRRAGSQRAIRIGGRSVRVLESMVIVPRSLHWFF